MMMEIHMGIALTSPVSGSTITGFSAHTYAVSVDTPPNAWSKQWAVTGIAGTQAGVDTGSAASRPWTLTGYRPQSLKTLNAVDSTGVLRVVGFNVYGFLQRKGLTPLAGQASKTAQYRAEFSVPAGADSADQPNIKGSVACFIGSLAQQSDGIANLLMTGVL
jgi:hypothetical protein